MQCIILHIELPDPSIFTSEKSNLWTTIERYLERSEEQNKEIQRLGESCWMIPLHTGLPAIAEAVYLAGKASFPYKTLHFDKKEDWISYPMEK
jgi:hypothetical protein